MDLEKFVVSINNFSQKRAWNKKVAATILAKRKIAEHIDVNEEKVSSKRMKVLENIVEACILVEKTSQMLDVFIYEEIGFEDVKEVNLLVQHVEDK